MIKITLNTHQAVVIMKGLAKPMLDNNMTMQTIKYRGLYIQANGDNVFYCSLYPEIKVNTLRKAKLLVTKILRNVKGYAIPLKDLKY